MAGAPACTASLIGWIEGEPWTRWRVAGEGQVRFWLRPLNEGGHLLCAVAVHTAGELRAATEMLAPQRQVELRAAPCALAAGDTLPRDEAGAGVVFLAREISVSGLPLVAPGERAEAPTGDHLGAPHPHRACGKMAAAGDDEEAGS